VVHVDDASALRELNAALERFRGEPRGALGVAASADAATARRAFMALAKVYHPARFARFAPATVKLSNEVFLAIRRAYETVIAAAPVPKHVPTHERVTTRMPRMSGTPASGVPISRAAADPTIPMATLAPPPPTPPVPAGLPRDEQDRFERALQHARAQRWPEARAAFSELTAQHPGVPRYRAYLHYVRGWEAFGLGRDGEAKAEWNRALSCDPSNGLARWALETTGLSPR
jgi:hypothetical protein